MKNSTKSKSSSAKRVKNSANGKLAYKKLPNTQIYKYIPTYKAKSPHNKGIIIQNNRMDFHDHNNNNQQTVSID